MDQAGCVLSVCRPKARHESARQRADQAWPGTGQALENLRSNFIVAATGPAHRSFIFRLCGSMFCFCLPSISFGKLKPSARGVCRLRQKTVSAFCGISVKKQNKRMALLYLQPSINGKGDASSCPYGVVKCYLFVIFVIVDFRGVFESGIDNSENSVYNKVIFYGPTQRRILCLSL